MNKYFLLFLLFLSGTLCAQQFYRQLSPEAEINVLTIGPGANLEDTFGHSALWVSDSSRGIDLVFNYGVFDFDTPNFVLKFASGKLPYRLGINKYEDFLASYTAQNRSIASQTLALSTKEKQQLFDYLQRNALPENKYYKYDFFYDNCATRLIDVTQAAVGSKVVFTYPENKEALTQRDLIHKYIDWNSWGGTGIDLALGSVIDRTASGEEFRFLPDYTRDAFAKANLKTPDGLQPLVASTKTIFAPDTPAGTPIPFLLSPLFIFSLVALALGWKTLKDFKGNAYIQRLDSGLLVILGLTGVVLVLLWFATDHNATAWNYNLLWAFPFHLLAALVIRKSNPPQWIYPYMKLAFILLVLLFLHWIIGVQSYPLPILPLLLALGFRYLFILKRLKTIRDA